MLNTISWLLTAQGRTEALLGASILAGIATIAAFVIGLPYGPIGVARAYAISEMGVRAPLMLWFACRRSTLTISDFAKIAAPLGAVAIATLVAAQTLRGFHIGAVALVIVVGLFAYAIALPLIGMFATGRAALAEAGRAGQRLFTPSTPGSSRDGG
jgi:PST family polysaccharide transporter